MNIEEIKKHYPDEWVLLEVLKENALSEPIEVKLVTHGQNRDDIYDGLLAAPEGAHLATMFTGDVLKEGYAAAFLLWP